MKALWKKLAILLLGFSNLAVLGTVFYTYFESEMQPIQLFSTSEDIDDLRQKIKKECGEELKELTEGKRVSFSCFVSLDQNQSGVDYKLKTSVDVIKTSEGKIKLISKGRVTTEADFCNGCISEEKQAQNNFEELLKETIAMAEKVYTDAQEAVTKTTNEKEGMERMASLVKELCQGKWDKKSKQIVAFNTKERLDCKMKVMTSLDLPLHVEQYYDKNKQDFWEIALSDEDHLLPDFLGNFNDAYRYPSSVRYSTGLMKSYLGWKKDFVVLESLERKENFVKGIQTDVRAATRFMTKRQSQRDLFFLNKGFDGILARLEALPTTPNLPAATPGVNYDQIKRNLRDQGLYD